MVKLDSDIPWNRQSKTTRIQIFSQRANNYLEQNSIEKNLTDAELKKIAKA